MKVVISLSVFSNAGIANDSIPGSMPIFPEVNAMACVQDLELFDSLYPLWGSPLLFFAKLPVDRGNMRLIQLI